MSLTWSEPRVRSTEPVTGVSTGPEVLYRIARMTGCPRGTTGVVETVRPDLTKRPKPRTFDRNRPVTQDFQSLQRPEALHGRVLIPTDRNSISPAYSLVDCRIDLPSTSCCFPGPRDSATFVPPKFRM